jgi:predicted RecB family nuclease
MTKTITSELVVAYSHCPRKAYLVCKGEGGDPHALVEIIERKARAIRERYLQAIDQPSDLVSTNVTLRSGNMEASCDVLMRRGENGYEPTLVTGTRKVTKDVRINLAYVAHVIDQLYHRKPSVGTIVLEQNKIQKVKLEPSFDTVNKIISALQPWVSGTSDEVPVVMLNEHCPSCQFRHKCKAAAEQADSLTLLDRMTPKLMRRFQRKGIFSVTQLSYLFRPRRKKAKAKASNVFKLELQALAIRSGEIYLQAVPSIPRSHSELFLDVEGLPVEDQHYLIGLTIRDGSHVSHRSFWSDSSEHERQMWLQFLDTIQDYPDARIYHYGVYERRVIEKVGKRYDLRVEEVVKRMFNVASTVYGIIYFPVRSNSLKDLGRFVGAKWTSPLASGLQSLVWRYLWEDTHNPVWKQELLTYNQEDCTALRLLTDRISAIAETAHTMEGVAFADRRKRQATDVGTQLHTQFEKLIKFAHFDYREKRISLRSEQAASDVSTPVDQLKTKRPVYRRIAPSRANKTVHVRRRQKCPRHNRPLTRTDQIAEKAIVDLAFTKNGCRKTVIKYVGTKAYCKTCGVTYVPPAIFKLCKRSFGDGIRAWVTYQRIALRQPWDAIVQMMDDMFEESMSPAAAVSCVECMARKYAPTETLLLQRLKESLFIHVDETRINIQGTNYYVWVFTDGIHVLFRLSATREPATVHDLLDGYAGVLVSDFYPGYDSVKCKQQKCLAHLLRDINDALWDNPFDGELERFASGVKDLLLPILQDVERFGLKRRHLGKHKPSVEVFYNHITDKGVYESDVAQTIIARFRRYRDGIFRFLEEDSIPWNNNTGERALRHLAVQRKISNCFFKEFAPKHLLLLGIAQTCKFQGKSFLKFLLSGAMDVDNFRPRKRRRGTRLVGQVAQDVKRASEERECARASGDVTHELISP